MGGFEKIVVVEKLTAVSLRSFYERAFARVFRLLGWDMVRHRAWLKRFFMPIECPFRGGCMSGLLQGFSVFWDGISR
jgi:hypothetical protein